MAARQLLHAGRKLEGLDFERVLARPLAGDARPLGAQTLFDDGAGRLEVKVAQAHPVQGQLPFERALHLNWCC